MSDKKKLVFTIIGGCAIMFLSYGILYSPLITKHQRIAESLKETKSQVEKLSEVSPRDLQETEKILSELNTFMEIVIPETKREFSREVTDTPADINITLISISPLPDRAEGDFVKHPVRLRLSGSLIEFLKYLNWLEQKSGRLIAVDAFNLIRPAAGEGGTMEFDITFAGFSLSRARKSIRDFPPETLLTLKPEEADRLRRSVKEKKYSQTDLSHLAANDPFNAGKIKTSIEPERPVKLPEPRRLPEHVKVSGIARAGEEKAVLIRDKVYREGDTVDGFMIQYIDRDEVTFSDNGNQYIIKLKE